MLVWLPCGSKGANYRGHRRRRGPTQRESRESPVSHDTLRDSHQTPSFQIKKCKAGMTEAKIYLGNLSYDARERWVVDIHCVVVVVVTLYSVNSCTIK